MLILGINGSLICNENHDTSVALFKDGKIIENIEEERLTRVKHSFNQGFPINSLKYILDKYNLTLNDIDIIGIPHQPKTEKAYIEKLFSLLSTPVKKYPKLSYHSHHMAHICDSFFQSGFDHAACLIVDGIGDISDSITFAHIKDNKIKILEKYNSEQSLGILYEAGAAFLGYREFSEGKLMGLSSYGIPNQSMPLLWEDNTIKAKHINSADILPVLMYEKYHLAYFKKECYPYSVFNNEYNDNFLYYANFAASLQKCYTDIFLSLAKKLKQLTNEKNLIISGGCIQNCIANNKLVESKLFENIFASPAPHDAGTAAGLAFYAAYENNNYIENKRVKNSYVGRTYSDNEILQASKGSIIKDYNIDEIVSSLKSDKIVAWFQGGCEIGPRALGHRSILANPKNRNTLLIINNFIKERECWRPLAPIVPAELFDLIFETNSYDLTEFMLRTMVIRKEWRKKLSAVCHIDYTTRPQRLEKEQNPELYELLMKFYKKTGIPCLINTSFNRRNEPIIETPEQAINCLYDKTKLNCIIFNNKYCIYRNEI